MHQLIIWRTACFTGIALCLLGGCSGPPSAEVSGTVTYDGKLVAKGNLGLLGDDGRIAQCPIENGFYSLLAPVGHVSVSITGGDPSDKVMGPPIGGPKVLLERQKREKEMLKKDLAEGRIKELPKEPLRVPLRYSDLKTSGLAFEVKLGKQTRDFNLPREPEESPEPAK